jgi:hypothetical protein
MRPSTRATLGVVLLFGLCLGGPVRLSATTRYASTCSQTDVTAAISSAVAGDTVSVPAGSCNWSSTVTVSKNIVLQGAGIDVTTITFAGLALTFPGDATTNNSRVTGFTFNGAVQFNAPSNTAAWFRLDHNKIVRNTATDAAMGTWDNAIWGTERILIDHNTLTHTGSSDMRFWIFDGETGADPAVWREASAIGTAHNVFIEDNTITNTSVTSGNEMFFQIWWAGRVVLRYNTIHNMTIDVHDYRDGSQRGGRSWEVYENTWVWDTGFDLEWMNFRGGTGVVYNNTLTGDTVQAHGIHLMAYSAIGYVSPICCAYSPDYLFTMDNIGRGQFSGTKTAGDTSLATDCSLAHRPNWTETLEPAYFWNNTRNGSAASISVDGMTNDSGTLSACGAVQNESTVIQLNRDYYTSGARPGYSAYTYPHPLVSADSGTVSDPSTSPGAGTYQDVVAVTLSDATVGATICYTTDGSTPAASTPGTCSTGTAYSSPVSLTTTTTLKALGTLSGYTNSGVVSATYTIVPSGIGVSRRYYSYHRVFR